MELEPTELSDAVKAVRRGLAVAQQDGDGSPIRFKVTEIVLDEQQTTAFGNIDSLGNAIGSPGDRTITQRLDGIERVLFALARAQGIDPDELA